MEDARGGALSTVSIEAADCKGCEELQRRSYTMCGGSTRPAAIPSSRL